MRPTRRVSRCGVIVGGTAPDPGERSSPPIFYKIRGVRSVVCPSCGAQVEFRNASWVAAVCAYCGSNLVRRDEAVESIGRVAALQEDGSVLQIGTRGRLAGKPFMLLGRLQRSWEKGAWSEWYADFGDGREGWLAEAMGFYYFTFRQQVAIDAQRFSRANAGGRVTLAGHDWKLTDLKDCRVLSAQGELPEPVRPGFASRCIDLVSEGRRCATVEIAEGEPARFYAGQFADFEELGLTGLREIDGW